MLRKKIDFLSEIFGLFFRKIVSNKKKRFLSEKESKKESKKKTKLFRNIVRFVLFVFILFVLFLPLKVEAWAKKEAMRMRLSQLENFSKTFTFFFAKNIFRNMFSIVFCFFRNTFRFCV